MTARYRRSLVLSTAIAALFTAASIRPVSAQSVTATGLVDPTSASPSNWDLGTASQLVVGDGGDGTLDIENGGTVSDGFGTIGWDPAGGGQSTLTVSGSDGSGNASTWTNAFPIFIGMTSTASLLVENGGVVNSDEGNIGADAGSIGTVTVSGSGSTWNANNIYVGGTFGAGTGTLDIEDGGAVSIAAPGGDAASLYIGYTAGAQGTVDVASSTGNTSTLTTTDRIEVGESGTGTLNIEKGGEVDVGSDVYIAVNSTASGTLNLDGDATGRGVLQTGSVIKGDGAAILNLDGGILRATRDETNFLNGFTALSVGSEGAWFDTNTHDIGIGTAFSGSSSFNKLGLGTLTLTGDSSAFTGTTTISGGTLQLGDGGASGTIGGNVTDNAVLAFNRSDTLDFARVVSGSGALNQIGTGTTILSSANTYTGGTTISAGTLQLGMVGPRAASKAMSPTMEPLHSIGPTNWISPG
jgi:T5SS/PEP-CTERM-associated repeat protein/autotransporter-associated beta strand protein